jgi:transposase InsO family protein
MPEETGRRYLFVAIDRSARRVFVRVMSAKTVANARCFLTEHASVSQIKIRSILMDNGKAFSDRLFASRCREPTGHDEFYKICAKLEIVHRLIKPPSIQINGMVELFNGVIADVLNIPCFMTGEHQEQAICYALKHTISPVRSRQ